MINTLKHWYERIKYGISYQDCWDLDYYLAKVTLRGLQHLQENSNSFFPQVENAYKSIKNKGEQEEKRINKQDKIYDEMIYAWIKVLDCIENPETIQDITKDKNFIKGLREYVNNYFHLWD